MESAQALNNSISAPVYSSSLLPMQSAALPTLGEDFHPQNSLEEMAERPTPQEEPKPAMCSGLSPTMAKRVGIISLAPVLTPALDMALGSEGFHCSFLFKSISDRSSMASRPKSPSACLGIE